MPRITIKVDPFVEKLLAEFGFSPGNRIRAAPFISAARVKTQVDEIAGRLRCKNDRIDPRLECVRVFRRQGFLNGFSANPRSIELGNIKMISQKITGAA